MDGSRHPDWLAVGFSTGAWDAPLSPRAVSEVAPIPGNDLGVLALGNPAELVSVDPVTGDHDVDWDRDGTVAGVTYMRGLAERNSGRMARWGTVVEPQGVVAAPDAAIANGLLYVASVTSSGAVELHADADADCNRYPLDIRGGAVEGYPACVRHGTRSPAPCTSCT